jgi:glutathione S-transferase
MPNSALPPIKLHRHPLSGHSHRVELLLSLLELPHDLIDVDMRSGAHKTSAFLDKNPLGQVPVIEDGDVVLSDSNAILVYLAGRYDKGGWLPRDALLSARVQWWLSLAAGPIAAGPCAARLVNVFNAPLDHGRAKAIASELLSVVEAELGRAPFAVGDQPTIADVAAYTYIAHAPEGGVALDGFPAVKAWIRRIEALPRFVAMRITPVGLRAS